jgi:hypothetical protein
MSERVIGTVPSKLLPFADDLVRPFGAWSDTVRGRHLVMVPGHLAHEASRIERAVAERFARASDVLARMPKRELESADAYRERAMAALAES